MRHSAVIGPLSAQGSLVPRKSQMNGLRAGCTLFAHKSVELLRRLKLADQIAARINQPHLIPGHLRSDVVWVDPADVEVWRRDDPWAIEDHFIGHAIHKLRRLLRTRIRGKADIIDAIV